MRGPCKLQKMKGSSIFLHVSRINFDLEKMWRLLKNMENVQEKEKK